MDKDIKIRNMTFPSHDSNWTEITELLQDNNWSGVNTIAPVEFCNKLGSCFPYEWSYWNDLPTYECLIIHKGMYDRLKNDFLDNLEDSYDYVFGNAVFNVYVLPTLNSNKLKGHAVHFSLNTIIQALKKLLKIGKQFKAKAKQKNILLVTANHSGNIGDDAITLAAQDILQSVYPDANIVIDKGPASKELISKVDLVVLGGGGIFYDSCFYNSQNYCQYLLYAHEYGIKSCAIGIGAQGIMGKYGIELYNRSISKMEFIMVRDDVSHEVLTVRVKAETSVLVNRDVVFSLQFNSTNKVINKNKEKKSLLYSLVDSSKMTIAKATQKYTDSHFDCMQYLSNIFEVTCIVQSSDDLYLYNQFQEQFDIKVVKLEYSNTKDVLKYYKSSDLVFTSRLHGFIFAAIAQVPVISVSSNSPRTKLGGLIKNYIKSAEIGILIQKNYSLDTLKTVISKYNQNPRAFIPDIHEINHCKNLTNKIASEIKERIGNI